MPFHDLLSFAARHPPSLTGVIATFALFVSAATFYRHFFFVRHDLVLVPVGVNPPDKDYREHFTFAVVNVGNRDVMLMNLDYCFWDFKTQSWRGSGVYSAFPGPCVLKPQEIKLVALKQAVVPRLGQDVFEGYHKVWNEKDEVELGLAAQIMDSNGVIYRPSFPIGSGNRATESVAENNKTGWRILAITYGAKNHLIRTGDIAPYFGSFFRQAPQPRKGFWNKLKR